MKPITRRTFLSAAMGVAAVLSTGLPSALAQAGTPTAEPDLSTYPTLTVTIADAGYTLSSDSVPAGLVLFTVSNTTKNPVSAGVLGPGPGKTMADLQQAAATPAPDNGFPPFLYDATVLGGPQDVAPGGASAVLLNIPAGDWVVFGDGPGAPVPLTSAASGDSKSNEPAAGAEIVFGDFTFNGFDNLKAGDHLWKITNKGAQPHMLVLNKVPAGTTDAQVNAALMEDMTGTPAAGALSEDQIQQIDGGVLLLSTGQTMWLPLKLDAGTYLAMCFVTDPATGKPHAMEGMAKIFVVS